MGDTTMNILHVIPSMAARTGGPAFSTATLSQLLQGGGAEIAIYTTDLVSPAKFKGVIRGVTIDEMPSSCVGLDVRVFPIRQPFGWAYAPDLGKNLRRHNGKVDVVHIHSLNLYPQFAAWRYARNRSIPFVISPRGALDQILLSKRRGRKELANRLWQASMLSDADAIHATSAAESLSVASLGIRSEVEVLPNMIEEWWFAPESASSESSPRLGEIPLIVNHGRLSEKKGLDVLIRAFQIVKQDFPTAQLLLVGPDDENMMPKLSKLARDCEVHQDVVFAGPLTGAELRATVARADVWVLPSRGENFGMAVMEAMAAGVAVVSSPQVGIAAAAEREGALQIAPNDPVPLAAALVQFLRDPGHAADVGNRGNRFARSYGGDYLLPLYWAMYERAIERHLRAAL